MWELLPSNIMTCVPPFMQFTKRGLEQLQKNISNRLHDHFFPNIIFDMVFNSHHACLSLTQAQG